MNLITNIGNKFQEVKHHLNIKDVAARLGSKLTQQGRDTYQGTCPTGHTSQSGKSFNIDSKLQVGHCFNCGLGGDAISLVEKDKGLSRWESLKWLNDEFALKIDLGQPQHNHKPTLEQIKEEQEQIKRSMIFQRIYEIGKEKLFAEEGAKALKYLTDVRGYEKLALEDTEWFYLPEEYDIKKKLIDDNQDWKEDVGKLKLQGHYGDNFRLAFPYRNNEGMITGFLKRASDSKGISITTYDDKIHEGVRWDSTPGLKKDDLFGLDKIDKNEDTLLIVEGYPDALYLKAMGIDNITAVGQGKLGKKHLESLRKRKIKNLIIAFDNDEVGPKNSEGAVRLVLENSNMTAYVIDPVKYGNMHKDPDEYLKANGLESLKNLFNQTEDGVSWIVHKLIGGLVENNSMQNKKIKESIFDFLSIVKDEAIISEIMLLLKKSFGENIPSLRNQLKGKMKDYKDGLADHISNDPIVPMLDMTSNSRGYYDAEEDELKLGIDKEFIIEVMVDFGIRTPESFPAFRVKFDPQDMGNKFDLNSKKFNQFTPTEYMLYEKNDDTIDFDVSCPRIYFLLKNLIPVNEERKHFLNWFSYVFSTRLKVDTAWVFQGIPGAGKNLFFDSILRPLFGKKQTIVVDDDRLQSDFNGYMSNKLFVAFNEVANDETKTKRSVKSKIKTLVSENTMLINEKFVRAYETTNDANILFFSNEALPLLIEKYDRRINVVETGNALKNKPTFSINPKKFVADLEKELPRFVQFLLNYSCNDLVVNEVMENDAKNKIKELSMNRFELFATKLKEKDWYWFDENYPNPGTDFLKNDNRDGLMTEAELNTSKVLRETAHKSYNRINDGWVSLTKLTRQLKISGITIERKKYSNKPDEYFYKF